MSSSNVVIDPRTTAVVCVECQAGVLGENSVLPALAADARAVVPGIEKLVRSARAAGATVVHATFEGRLGAVNPGTAPLWRAIAQPTEEWAPGHPAVQVLPELYAEEDLVLPRHHGLSPTWGTELLPVLRARGVRTLVLAGVSLNVAIVLGAGEAAHEGFEVVVARDAVTATPADYGEQMLRHTFKMMGRVLTVDQIGASWQACQTEPDVRSRTDGGRTA
ncbi:cysteine hydrolase [Amycolatopsis thermoflava]|uniref:cysteine hydrolase n=1 Tax=Amycolatopsis thermoflava TaxID=84480 RepID=UPI00380FFF1D